MKKVQIIIDLEDQYNAVRLNSVDYEFTVEDLDQLESIDNLINNDNLKKIINKSVEIINSSAGLQNNELWEQDDSELLKEELAEFVEIEIYELYLNTENSNFVLVETDEGKKLMYEVAENVWKIVYDFPGDYLAWDVAYYATGQKIIIHDK